MCIGQSSTSAIAGSRISHQDLLLKPVNATTKSAASSSSSSAESHNHHQHPKGRHEHIIVQHDYHDHAFDEPPQDFNSCELAYATAATSASGANTAFPLKLYDMLQRVEEEGLSHVVSWQPHGRAFLVHKPDEFAKILPHYFKQKKIASFQRQLNLYGFMRLTRGADRNAYYHERFLRGRPFLIAGISRCKVKGTGVRARSNPDQEPNFWKMVWVGDKGNTSSPNTGNSARDAAIAGVMSCAIKASAVMNSAANKACNTSVVSADDNHRIQEDDEDLEPLPIVPHNVRSSAMTASQKHEVVMSGWGMPFYYLEEVPSNKPVQLNMQPRSLMPQMGHPGRFASNPMCSLEPQPIYSSAYRSSAPVVQPSSSDADILDDTDFERALESLLQDNDDGDLAVQLEELVA